ncbi:hypothetical protein NZK35_30175 [Stieleria sp. ICT_E10.1]|uniref:GumC family protein n=1 Tax=Stieleria sedimenti TaxID=2976331 RepID=UPI00218085C2|nr:hypothetical protein [Stieleria sedimenti]MCS7470943.1 hypothetical protein [Stieleria sedimenti]
MNSFFMWRTSLRRHWFAAAFSFVTVIAIAVAVVLYAPRQYRSVSKLLLRVGYESATLDPTMSVVGNPDAPVKTREDEVETTLDVMHSRTIMEDVVERLGPDLILDEKLPSAGGASEEPSKNRLATWIGSLKTWVSNIDPISTEERAIRALEQSMDISASEKSSLVKVEFKSTNPQVAQTIVSNWVDAYLAHHAQVNRTRGTYAFFREQDAELKQQLDEVQSKIRDAKNAAGFATLDGRQKQLETQLEKVSSELFKVEADLVEFGMRAETYADLLANSVARTVTEQTSGLERKAHNDMRTTLFQLEVLENEYAAKFKTGHPKLTSIREQLEKAREIVDAQDSELTESREVINPTHQQLFASQIVDLASEKSLLERRKKLQEQRGFLLTEINALNEHEQQLSKLQRNALVLEERYKLHSVMLEQARLNEELESHRITSINVSQPATLEERPVSPNKPLCAMAGLIAAFGLAMGVPVLLDFRSYLPIEPVPHSFDPESAALWEESSSDLAETPDRVSPSVPIRIDKGEVVRRETEAEASVATRPR